MISHNHHQPNPRQTLTRQTMPRQHRSGRSREAHSVETLVSTYIGAMEGDDTEANTLVDQVLATGREQILMVNEGL